MKNRKSKLAGLAGTLLALTILLNGCAAKEDTDTIKTTGAAETEEAARTSAASETGTEGSQAAGTDPFAPDHTIKIRFATGTMDSDDNKAAWEAIFAAYKEVQPNVEIEPVPLDWANQRTWLTMQLTGGTAPEVFQSKLSWATDDYNKGLIRNINDLMESPNPYTDTPTWKEFYAPSVISQMQAISKDYYSTCNYMDIVKVFYNKDMFTRAGVTDIPETWGEFLDVQKKLKETGFAPFAVPNSKPADNIYNWTERLLTYQVVEELLPELDVNGSGSIETSEIVRGIDLDIINIEKSPFSDVFPILKEWSQYWAEGYNAIDFTTAEQMFIRQDAAMMLGMPGTAKNMTDMGADFEYGVFTFPYLTREDTPYACEANYEMGAAVTEVYCIPSNIEGDELAAAQDFLRFLGSPKVMEMMADLMYKMPTSAEPVTESLNGWAPEGRTVKLNLYGPAVDQTFFEDSVLFGQLYIGDNISLEEYLKELQNSLKDMAVRLKETNGWSEENNYGIVE